MDRVQYCLDLLESYNVLAAKDPDRNGNLLCGPLMSLSLDESRRFMDVLRGRNSVQDFVTSMLSVSPRAVSPENITYFWTTALLSGRVDFLVEILGYVTYTSESNGCFARDTVVDIYDYAAARDAIFHETFHAFNFVHGPTSGAWNEGTAIALPKWYAGEACHLGETVFGTVLYYRDIGIEGYPSHIEIGGPWQYDEKGKEFTRWLMRHDVSGIDWFHPPEVQRIFDAYWAPLNRNISWEEWLVQVEEVTRRIKYDKANA